MKYFTILSIALVLWMIPVQAQTEDAERSWKNVHQELLQCDQNALREGKFEFSKAEGRRSFSIFSDGERVSLYTFLEGRHYLLSANQETHGPDFTVHFTLRVFQADLSSPATIIGTIERTSDSFALKLQSKPEGYTPEGVMTIAAALLLHGTCCDENWWSGLLYFDPAELESRSYYATRDEAVRNVPQHVSPKYCFVWRDGPASTPWRPIPGTGCAHWVAHQKGITASPGCYDRYAIRVSQVTSGKTRYYISEARVGDIWTNSDGSHCGIVIGAHGNYVRVRHCSSGSGGVVEGNFSSGYVYR